MKFLTGPEADRARAAAAPVLDRVCAVAGQPRPRLLIVERLPGSAGSSGQETAKAVFRGGPAIVVPAVLLDRLSPAAFEHLMAHELGHLVLRRSGWALAWIGTVALFLVGTASTFTVMALMIIRGAAPDMGLVPFGVLIVLLGVLPVAAYVNRRQEFEADLFATRIQGSLQGAREHMEHYARLRAARSVKQDRISGMLAMHPQPAQRMAYLERTFRDG